MARLHRCLALGLALLAAGCMPPDERAIRFATWGSVDEVALLKPLIAEFERTHPETPVELVHVPDGYFQKLPVMVASGQMPDVVFLNNWNLPAYASSDALADLGPLLAKDADLAASDFFAQALDAMRYRGKLHAIPRDLSNLVVYVNTDRLAEAGHSLPKPSWTLDEMRRLARSLTRDTDADGALDTFGISFDKRPLFWMPYVWSAGGDMFSADLSRSTLASPEAIAALQAYADTQRAPHAAPNETQTGNAPMAQLFAQGKLAMFVSGRWSVPGFRKNLTFGWDVLPFPRGKAGSVVDVDASGWAIARESRHPQAAWELVKFLASRRASETFAGGGLIVPARRDVAESPRFLDAAQAPKGARAFVDAIETGRPMRTPPNWNEVSNELDQQLEPLWAGREAAAPVLKRAAARIDELLGQP
ncbi:MAG TPA: sugar ABC transporter substrate-binding protein [Pantanalinema sp.]